MCACVCMCLWFMRKNETFIFKNRFSGEYQLKRVYLVLVAASVKGASDLGVDKWGLTNVNWTL